MFAIESCCRTCMCQLSGDTAEAIDSYNIFETGGLAEKLMQCSTIDIQPFDSYPSQVCTTCYINIMNFYEFQQMCRDSLEKFTAILEGALKVEQDEEEIISEYRDDSDSQAPMNVVFGDMSEIRVNEVTVPKNTILKNESLAYDPVYNSDTTSEDEFVKNMSFQDPLAVACNLPAEECVKNVCTTTTGNKNHKGNCKKLGDIEHDDIVEDDEKTDNKDVTKPQKLQCDLCSRSFRLQETLDGHKRAHEGLMEYPCPRENCGYASKRISDFRAHLKAHDKKADSVPRKLFSCLAENCNVKFKTKFKLDIHMHCIHGEKPPEGPNVRKRQQILPTTICDICGASFRGKNALEMHLLCHVDKAKWPYVCDKEECSKRFKARHQLLTHQKRHAGIKDYSCPQCDMKFVTSANLRNHLNVHTRERSWPCNFCSYIAYANVTLKNHIQMKHGNPDGRPPYKSKTYPCSFCDRVCSTHTAKIVHERIHTGEKPFVCEVCGKQFTQPNAHKAHMRTHVKDAVREFVCRFCKRGFYTSVTCKHHEMKHTKEKPYKCEECGMSFRWPNNVRRHRKLHVRDKLAQSKSFKSDSINTDISDSDQDINEEILNIDIQRYE